MKKLFPILAIPAVFLIFFFTGCSRQTAHPVNGVLTLPGWDGSSRVNLDGEWEFYWEQFYLGDDFKTAGAAGCRKIIQYFDNWHKAEIGGWKVPEYGYATYRLTADIRDYRDNEIFMLIPSYDYAVKIFCNGREIFSNGPAGKSRESSFPVQYRTVFTSFAPVNGKLELVMHVSNFNSPHAGIRDAIIIGNRDKLISYSRGIISIEMFIAGLLAIMLFYNIFVFIIWKGEWVSLYFALICLSTLGLLMSNGTCLFSSLGIQWKTVYDLNNLSWYILLLSFYLYTISLFGKNGSRGFTVFAAVSVVLFSAVLLVTPVAVYTRLDKLEMFTGLVILLYCIKTVLTAAVKKTEFALSYSISSVVFLLCIINDLFRFVRVNQFNYFLTMGCVLFIIIQTMILAKRGRSFLIRNIHLMKELENKSGELETINMNLEKIVEEKTAELKEQNKLINMNNRIIKSNNIELEKRISEAIEDLRQKDDVIILNSRLASLGEMIGFIGHQWKQNIYAISLFTEALKNILQKKGSLDIETAGEPLGKIDSFIIEMYNNLNDFTDFIKPKKEAVYFSISDAVEETLILMHDFITINSVELIRDYKSKPCLNGFSNELKQVIMNIIKNSIDSFNERKIKDRVIVISSGCNSEVNILSIRDNAGGIPLDNPDTVFDKFYTSKEDGTGLGLYLSRIVIEQRFGGKINVRNTEGGASFIISIPVSGEETVL